MYEQAKPFILEAHEDTGAGIRELAFNDPELAYVAGADGKVCCTETKDGSIFCGQDIDA